MRVFAVKCKDSKTGYTMVLSECSYNMACDWLQRIQRDNGRDVFRVEKEGELIVLYTGKQTDGYDMSGQTEKFYSDIVRYYYDEDRGYLLDE